MYGSCPAVGAAPLKAGQALRGLSLSGMETPWPGTGLTYFFCEHLLADGWWWLGVDLQGGYGCFTDLVMMEEREEIASPREEHRGSPSKERWSKPMTLRGMLRSPLVFARDAAQGAGTGPARSAGQALPGKNRDRLHKCPATSAGVNQ